MRPQYRSRGRPDYGGGGAGGGGRFGGNFRGSRGRGRHMRRPSFDHRPAVASSPHIHHNHHDRTQQHPPQHFRSPERSFHPGHQHPHHHHHHHHHRQELLQEERYPVAAGECSHRTESPWQRDNRGVVEVATVVRPESPTPSDRHRKRKRRHRSPASPVLSNISSGSSFYIEEEVEVEVDSDGNVSPDYDEVTSDESLEEEEVEVDEEEEEEIVVVKKKKRKKDKKKKDRERRHRKKEKRRKKEILEERICPPEHEVAAQKEIFSSGQNILVSVSFDDEGVGAGAEADAYKAYRKAKKKKSKRAKLKEERRKQEELLEEEYTSSSQKRIRKLDDSIKPVAIIDLERSPGKQVISSPKEVIVLSDEEAGGSGKKKNKSGAEQVGPNTPPEPAPKSPESYDPFDPTKSPMDSLVSGVNMGSISTVSYPDHHHHHHHRQRLAKEIASPDLNSADDGILDLHPSSPMDNLTPRQPFRQHSPQKPQRSTPAKKPSAAMPSGWDDPLDDGDISPYSPRSSDCDDHMFDPPDGGGVGGATANSSTQQPKTIALTVDNLRRVFGNDKNTLYGDLRRPNEAVQLVDEMYKPQKVTMEMLDDIPNSAVDLQIKEKLIQKLQRQDRIIEEVKIFLKPHFNKKHINKEEYKTIMKKSVPKICHSRSGEINPVKIQNLIMAYVKKAMAKRKVAGSSSGGNAIVSSTTAVT